MPTYEYECTRCGHTFETIQRMNDKPLTSCPECQSSVRRIIGGGIGVIFKGSGFCTTDNKKGSALSGGDGSNREKDKDASKEKPSESGSKPSESGSKPAEASSKTAESGSKPAESGSKQAEKTPVT